MRYRVSSQAREDILEIFSYWADQAGLKVADRVIERITARFRLVAEHHQAGKAVVSIAPGLRCFPVGKYLIYYRRVRRVTEILHVFHGARDQLRAFRPR